MAFWDTFKQVAAAVGVVVPLTGIYAASGLPVPATTGQLEAKIEPIRYGLTSLEIVVLQQQKESIRARRNFLRQDKFQLLTAIKAGKADPLSDSRLAEIEDSLQETQGRDVALDRRIQELTGKPWDEKLDALNKQPKK